MYTLFISETELRDATHLIGFEGHVISMAALVIKSRSTIGIAFLTRERVLLCREAVVEGARGKWQMLVVKARDIRIMGIYASPSASEAD